MLITHNIYYEITSIFVPQNFCLSHFWKIWQMSEKYTLFPTMGNIDTHTQDMANYKDQGVKNHEIERLTPKLLKFSFFYMINDRYFFVKFPSTNTRTHISYYSRSSSFSSCILFLCLTLHSFWWLITSYFLCVYVWERIDDICHWKYLRSIMEQFEGS